MKKNFSIFKPGFVETDFPKMDHLYMKKFSTLNFVVLERIAPKMHSFYKTRLKIETYFCWNVMP